MVIEYLREVHSYCFYCARQFRHQHQMYSLCGKTHRRGNIPEPEKRQIDPSTESAGTNGNAETSDSIKAAGESEPSKAPVTWGSALDIFNQARMEQANDYEQRSGRAAIAMQISEWVSQCTIPEAENFRCGLCRKLFRGTDFVAKHLELKHPEEPEEIETRVLRGQLLANFERDPTWFNWVVTSQTRENAKRVEAIALLPAQPTQPSDPRGLRDYVDLDAPVKPASLPDYRSQVSYDDI